MSRNSAHEEHITPSVVQDAIVQIMQGDAGRARNVDVNMARVVAGNILTSVQRMGFRGASSGVLSGNAAFHTLVTQHLGSTSATAYDPVFRQQLIQAIEKANITGADYIAGVKAGLQIGLKYAEMVDGRGHSDANSSSRSLSSYKGDLPTNYTPSNLSSTLQGLVDTSRGITPRQVADAANFAQRIGIEPGPYAGYFTGASQTMQTAIERHIKAGDKITDDHIKNPNDVKAVLGAIKAGKMKKEDAPPAMQQIIKDMEAKGIKPDSADPKVIEQYFKDNPKALEAVKKEVKKDSDKAIASGMTSEQLVKAAEIKAEKKQKDAKTTSTAKTAPVVQKTL